MIWLAGLCIAGLVVVYLSRPAYIWQRVSSARFFAELAVRRGERRLALGNPLRSPPFFAQLAALGLILLALMLADRHLSSGARSLGVWLVIDTSHSMTAAEPGGSRINLAREAAHAVIEQARAGAVGLAPCVRLTTFDRERRDLVSGRDFGAVERALDGLEPRPQGTDLGLAQALVTAPHADDCPITHVVFVSDRPAPDWDDVEDRRIVWLDIGTPIVNVGITAVRPVLEPLTGTVRELEVEAEAAFGTPAVTLEIVHPSGATSTSPVAWPELGPWRGRFAVTESGTLELRLDPGGAYSGDDRVDVDVPTVGELVVDWGLPDLSHARRLGLSARAGGTGLRVIGEGLALDDRPTLVIGSGYGAQPDSIVLDFHERHPLLADLNFGVLELAGAARGEMDDGFEAIITAADGSVWVAARRTPPAVRIPGLPTVGDDATARFSSTLFFNSLGWVLRARGGGLEQRVRTSEGEVIRGADGEGRRSAPPRSRGAAVDIVPVAGVERLPLWPLCIVIGLVLFAGDQVLASWWSRRWR